IPGLTKHRRSVADQHESGTRGCDATWLCIAVTLSPLATKLFCQRRIHLLEQSISYLTKNQDLIIAFGLKLLVAIVIFYIGRWVALGASQLVS
ncbi:hypothetical protein DVW31_16190, partial [Enterococcus faecium]